MGTAIAIVTTTLLQHVMCSNLRPVGPGFVESKLTDYDGWTEREIDDKCRDPRNCDDCRYDCPSKYEDGCKEMMGCSSRSNGNRNSRTYDGWTEREIDYKCRDPRNCDDCRDDCPSKYEDGCREMKGCSSRSNRSNGNRNSRTYDGWTASDINDACNDPKNCNGCKKDCPSKYKEGCKEMKGCGGIDEDALAFA